MTLEELLKADAMVVIGGIIVTTLTFIEVIPLKINPWTKLGKMIVKALNALGDLLNKNLIEKIDNIENHLTQLDKEVAKLKNNIETVEEDASEREAVTRRNRILSFGDEILHGTKFSKERFDQILGDITFYEKYCDEHPDFKNHITSHHNLLIENEYQKNLENNTFL